MALKRDQMKHKNVVKRKELDTFFKESQGNEEEVVMERSHRMKTDKNKKSNTPITIVCRILNYKDQFKILRNAKRKRALQRSKTFKRGR